MPELFTVPFIYKGVTREVTCTVRVSAYTYQLICHLDDFDFLIERDDSGNLRVLDADPFLTHGKKPDAGLIQAMISEVERILQE